jgi:subtilase family serine protease
LRKFKLWKSLLFLPLAYLGITTGFVFAQQPTDVNENLRVLHGTVNLLARPQYDRGAVDDSLPMRRLLLVMAHSAEKETALQTFLHDAHTPGASFHKWVTPEEYGARFGSAGEDIDAVSSWLQSHGFSVDRVGKNRTIIEFSGTAGQVRQALHTEIHRYQLPTGTYYANATEISVPEAIAARVSAFAPLNSFPLTSYVKQVGQAAFSRSSHRAVPDFTTTEDGNPYFYAVAPEDFATQYDVSPVYKAGTDGTGETIGIIGTSNINLAQVDAYRTLFNLPADHTQVIVDGNDPGDPIAPNVEAFLDVEVSGAVAPNATVNFYVAGGQPFQDSLALAALRAIEDNQASVMSLSYGNCEQLLGNAGNQLWNGLWMQAAAQGQTVMVSSGDSGPATCPFDTLNNGVFTPSNGLSVNGLSSTPWNVSVGGTDFYYSDYASGAPSAATLWNQINDGSQGSLKAPLPEQPWDNFFGLNAIPNSLQEIQIPGDAGGGDASNCSQQTDGSSTTVPGCVAGYPKPTWQSAPGVPNDQERDLPDISLFAANGPNLSAWAICVYAWECTADDATPRVLLVGGTSASSPAMAGIMALVDQKYGRQGQADFTLYSLARQSGLSVFHDITLGTNDVLCNAGGPNCSTPVSAAGFDPFIDSFGVYSSGPGYDQASGLGSLDVSQLIADWSKASFTSTTTSLQLSPASVAHGSPVTVSASVKAASGTAVPSGNIALTSTSPTPIPATGALTLANGMVSANLSTLPGGTYTVTADYSGDGTFGPSVSTPVNLTVTPEASATALNFSYSYTELDSQGFERNQTATIAAGSQVPFGSDWWLEAIPTGTAANAPQLATGSVSFTDGTTTATVPLNINGVATWLPQNLALGAHSISVKYSGDGSYNASSAGPLAFTVGKGTPVFSASPDASEEFFTSTTGPTYEAGSEFVVHVTLRNQGSFIPPSGTVVVSLGSTSQTLTLTANAYLNTSLSNVLATFSAVPAGTYTLIVSYAGDSNWNAATYSYPEPLTFVANSSAPAATTTTLTFTPATVDSSGSVTFNVAVHGSAPLSSTFVGDAGSAQLYANGTEFGGVTLTASSSGNGQNLTGSALISASELPSGSSQVLAVFPGSLNFASSVSATVPLVVTPTAFTLAASASNLAVKSGQTLTVPLNLSGPYGASVPVTLSCAPSMTSIGCTVNPASATVSGSGSATVTINAFIPGTAASASDRERPRASIFGAGGVAFAVAIAWVLPYRRRRYWMTAILAMVTGALLIAGCGGSSPPIVSKPIPGPQNVDAPAGSYSVVVTGVSGGITHNVRVNFVVQ